MELQIKKNDMNIKKTKTNRGFELFEFNDRYGNVCNIQKSSLAEEDAIWFGIEDANPLIMATDARRLGIQTEETNGWIAYDIPEEVLISTRMHLTQEQVKQLLPILQKFAETGEI